MTDERESGEPRCAAEQTTVAIRQEYDNADN